MAVELDYGPLMIDIVGHELSVEDHRRLLHPLVGGVILFARNYRDPTQLRALTQSIHDLRDPPLPVAVDHEGGRVQRCREGFTRLPPMRALGRLWDQSPEMATRAAREVGAILAADLRACGVDFSFAPVLDLDWGRSAVIGDRAFHRDPEAVIVLAGALIDGMRAFGLIAIGKHFPGHGYVEADSHLAIPIDERDFPAMADDLRPFQRLPLDGVMPAHVIYPAIDERPAGFSRTWMGILRQQVGFTGIVFSDDLSMAGAGFAGDILGRADAAWQAGCDVLLVCNAPGEVDRLLDDWRCEDDPERRQRRLRLMPTDNVPSDSSTRALADAGRTACLRLNQLS